MLRNPLLSLLSLLLFVASAPSALHAQSPLTYQTPPDAINKLVDVPLAPGVLMDRDKKQMVLLYRDAYKSIEELSQQEMRLAGLRIDPKTNIGSRTTYYNALAVRPVDSQLDPQPVEGLPAKPRLTNFTWSPDHSKIAMTHTSASGVELWVLEVATGSASRVSNADSDPLNANMGDVINWDKDGNSMLVKFLPEQREALIDGATAVPSGPTISTADGKKAQNRTYQDLLKNPNDEHNFEQLSGSTIKRVYLDGRMEQWLPAAMYRSLSYSPDGEYVMVTTVERPFSYLVPYYRFPSVTKVYDRNGELVRQVNEVPLIEDLPKGFMAEQPGKRDFSWRDDVAATLLYAKALDGGDPATEAPYRDQLYTLEAPFSGDGVPLAKLVNRYGGVEWGDAEHAILYDYWWDTRNTKTYLLNPSAPESELTVLSDRNYQDQYSDPGSFVTEANEYGRLVIALEGSTAYLLGDGFTEDGQFPFLDAMDLRTGSTDRKYTSEVAGKVEDLRDYDPATDRLLVRMESPTDYPNYYFREVASGELSQVTDFTNPFAALGEVHKEVITYERADGLELSGTLYLPVGYDMDRMEKMPMILWAYPREFKDKSSASQKTSNPNEFIYPYWGSPIYWVTRGYVVLDDAAFPIVGEGEEEPNDSFRDQLVANAKAAIDAVDALGYIDRDRVAVGGHSYGAFMVANLLSHSDLFAAGIARSGAYNRTLTPFGFQSEQRSYWEAPEVYYGMSPFMHADKMKTPLLLTHGEADNNSGTYPLQSERYFNALKGLGATVRLVMLPKESHGYRAKESILHLLWEQDAWLEKWVKNRESRK